jgi:acetyl-CoA synthetase (ADP-forming)
VARTGEGVVTDGTSGPVERILKPRSIAVIGATEDRTKFAGRVFHLLLKHGFPGTVYPVNPKRSAVHGISAYPRIAEVPTPTDLAVIAIPKPGVLEAVTACAEAGIGTVIIITSQFSEIGSEGKAQETALVDVARRSEMRILGPNCLGLFSPVHRLVLTSSPALDIDRLTPGPIGFVSQSGALMATVFDRANALGIDFSSCFSVGNQADLEIADFVEYLIQDEATKVICSYVEGFKTPERMLMLAEKARAAGKPWLITKAGRSEASVRAAFSHTASLAGSYAALQAVADRYGIVLMDDPDAMIVLAAALSRFESARIDDVIVVSTSGGCCAIAVDRLADAAIPLSRFRSATTSALAKLYPPAQADNPVDLSGRRAGEIADICEETIEILAGESAQCLVLGLVTTAPALDRIAANLARPAVASRRPHLFVMCPGAAADPARAVMREQGGLYCDRIDDAVRAVRGWLQWSRSPEPTDVAVARPAALPTSAKALVGRYEQGFVDEVRTKSLLGAYAVPVNPTRLAMTKDQALAAADAIGYPVALKAVSEHIVHKSDVGGVALGLADRASVAEAWDRILAGVARHMSPDVLTGMAVQAMAEGEAEVIIGARNDSQFGALVLVGAGGIFVEIAKDVQTALAPATPAEVRRLLQRLRVWPLLEGYRGRGALDVDAVVDIVCRVGWLASDLGDRLGELDLNPVLVARAGRGAVVADARLILA